ncbi:MAG: hypothetical protein NTY93_03030 [Candidatus Kaiserbacteria bacterium]|nr:hypothetical protein [Candidatus Kaiserbacteria bacterium]
MSETLLGVELGLLVAGLVGLFLLVYYAAQNKIFFTAPKEGTAEFVVVGNAVKRMIMVWKGHSANEQFAVELNKSQINKWYLHFRNPINWMKPLGIYWIGLWPFYQIYRYDFVWTEERKDDEGAIIPFTRRAIKKGGEGQTPYIRNDIKTKSGIALKFILLVTIRIENPYKALFSGEDWLERTGGAINNMTMRYAGSLEYEGITASLPATLTIFRESVEVKETNTLEGFLKMLGDGQADDAIGTDLLLNYGIRIVAAKIHSLGFANAEAAKQLSDATTQRYVAEQKGLGEQAEATGKAMATRTLADAEEYRINKIYLPIAGEDKDARMNIRKLEAMEKSGAAGGNTIVVPDELLGLARRVSKIIQK